MAAGIEVGESVNARYADLWNALRAAGTLNPPAPRRAIVTVVVVRVTDGALFRRLDRIRHAIGAVANVQPVPDHFLHLPVLDLGRVAPTKRLAARTRELVADLPPLVVELSKVNADARDVFGELHPADGLLALRERLRPLVGEPADEPFVPRLPLGRLVGPVDASALARAIDWFRDRPIGAVRIERLAIGRLRRVPFPWLQPVADVPLARPD